jgi:hypothetical protein
MQQQDSQVSPFLTLIPFGSTMFGHFGRFGIL